MRLRTAALAAASILAAVMGVVVPATPALAATCWGSSCLGQDPSATGCSNDGTTIASAWDSTGTVNVQVRYSATCSAYWARTQIYEPSAPTYNEAILYGWTSSPSYVSYTEDSGVYDSYTVWSNMIPTGFWVQACTDNYDNGVQLCTDTTGSGSGPN